MTATEIQAKQVIAKETEISIAEARKAYIPVAVRAKGGRDREPAC